MVVAEEESTQHTPAQLGCKEASNKSKLLFHPLSSSSPFQPLQDVVRTGNAQDG